MYDTKMITPEEEEKHQEETGPSTDWYEDLTRLNAVLKKLHTRLKKAYNTQNDELIVKLANAIGLMTSKRVDIVCIVLKVEELVKGRTYYRPK